MKKLIEKYTLIQQTIDEQTESLSKSQVILGQIKSEILDTMNDMGAKRVEHSGIQVVVAKRKSVRIKNDVQMLSWLKSENVPIESYMKVNKPMALKIGKDRGVDWIEEEIKESLTFRKKEEQSAK